MEVVCRLDRDVKGEVSPEKLADLLYILMNIGQMPEPPWRPGRGCWC